MPTTKTETREVTCSYCREPFRVKRVSARGPVVVRCPHCTNVALDPAVATKAAA